MSRFLWGLCLIVACGCGAAEEKPEPEKSTENGGEGKPKDQQKTPDAKPKAGGGNGTPFAWVPKETTVFASLRPVGAFGSEIVQAFPTEEFDREMQMMKDDVGFNLKDLDRVTVALWPGDGHVVPSLPRIAMEQEARARRRFMEEEKKFRAEEFEDFPEKPGEKFEEKPDAEASEDFENCQVEEFDEAEGFEEAQEAPLIDPFQNMVLNMLPKFDGALMVHFTKPTSLDSLAQSIPPLSQLQDGELDGKSYRVLPALPVGGGIAFYQADPNTLMIAFKDDLAEIFQNEGQSPLVTNTLAQGSDLEAAVAMDLQPFGGLLTMGGGMLGAQLPEVGRLLPKLKGTSVFVDLHTGADLDVFVDTADAETANTLKTQFDEGYGMLGEMMPNALERESRYLSEENQAALKKLTDEVYQSLKGETDAGRFHLSLTVPSNASEVLQKVAAEGAARSRGINNLKQIGLGFFNFHDVYNQFPTPAGWADKDRPEFNKLSWRVYLLPYLDEGPLFDEFKLDEPWDSEHNKALLAKMPDVFKVSDDAKPGMTQIVAPAGERFVVDGDKKRRIRDFTDGTSNSLMVVTVKPEHAVPWTKPGGFELDPKKAAEILGWRGGQFLAGFADGSVRPLDVTLKAETIKGLLTINGGEVLGPEAFGDEFDGADFKEDFPPESFDEPKESFKDVPDDAFKDEADSAKEDAAEEKGDPDFGEEKVEE